MAQMQPARQSQPMSDLMYDLVTELSQCGQAVSALDVYLEDAKDENVPEVVQLLEQMRQDKLRHGEMLRQCLRTMVQQGEV